MRVTEEFIQNLLRVNPGGAIVYCLTDNGMKCLGISEEICKASGYSYDKIMEIVKEDPFGIIHEEDKEYLQQNVARSFGEEKELRVSFRLWIKNNNLIWVVCRGKLIGDLDGYPVLFSTIHKVSLSNINEVTQDGDYNRESLVLMLGRYAFDTEHDELTGIYNRKKCYEKSKELLEAHPDELFAIVHFDIQHFRLYNSFFGEKEGDKLLIYIAEMFKELYYTHKYGVYGRIEADIFFLCFPVVEGVLEKNEHYIHNKLVSYRSDFLVTGASGVYIVRNRELSVEAMFNRAMEAGKNIGNKVVNHVALYTDEMECEMENDKRIASQMIQAIDNKEFVIYLQPKFEATTEKPYGAEALVRWIHPIEGLIPPNKFIPLFERNGFITTLDRYVWESVCELIHQWRTEGKRVAPISVNVSRVSMYNPETVDYLENLISKYDIPPSLFNLELTESAYMDNPDEMKLRFKSLQDRGFLIMMDDFGSGYSSLNTLRELSFDFLKVDRKFLASVENDFRSRALLDTVIKMAESIHIPVIAEGVETEKQRDILTQMGCEYIQGFLYAKPMPIEEYVKLVY